MFDKNRQMEKSKLLNFKKDYIVSVLNVQAIRGKIKQEGFFSDNSIDTLGKVDHKIIHNDPIEYHKTKCNVHNNIRYRKCKQCTNWMSWIVDK